MPVINKATGEPYERRDPSMVPCRTPVGCPKGTPENSKALNDRNRQAYEHYKRCAAVGRFPQDAIVEKNAAIIAETIREFDRFWLVKIASIMAGGR